MLFDALWCLAQVTEYRDRDHQCQGALDRQLSISIAN